MKKSKKNYVKRIASTFLTTIICMLTLLGQVNVFANEFTQQKDIVAPANIVIIFTDNALEQLSGGILECYGATDVQAGYTAYISVALQRKGSSWSTIKTWNDEGGV